MNESLKLVFMGTPDFAVPALREIHTSQHEVLLVVTQPDRQKGRGRQLLPPPVKEHALKFGYPVIQPSSIKKSEFIDQIRSLEPDVIIVVAFGQLLSESLLAVPKFCTLNIHPSLLPKYRGPAPIQWAIINGDKETGVAIMLMDKGMDTGPVVKMQRIEIMQNDNAESLHNSLAQIGASLLVDVLDQLKSGSISPIIQNHDLATYARPLTKEDGQIDWKKPADMIECFIRGVTPWPGAYTFHGNNRLKIFKAMKISYESSGQVPGTVIKSHPYELIVAAGKDALMILELQSASGKRLESRQFLLGSPISEGTLFS